MGNAASTTDGTIVRQNIPNEGIKSSNDNSNDGSFQNVPHDIIKSMLEYLDIKDLCRIAQVPHLFLNFPRIFSKANSTFKTLTDSNDLWEPLGKRYYGHRNFFPKQPTKADLKEFWIRYQKFFNG